MPTYIVYWEGYMVVTDGSEEFEAENDEEAEEIGREIALKNFSWGISLKDDDDEKLKAVIKENPRP